MRGHTRTKSSLYVTAPAQGSGGDVLISHPASPDHCAALRSPPPSLLPQISNPFAKSTAPAAAVGSPPVIVSPERTSSLTQPDDVRRASLAAIANAASSPSRSRSRSRPKVDILTAIEELIRQAHKDIEQEVQFLMDAQERELRELIMGVLQQCEVVGLAKELEASGVRGST